MRLFRGVATAAVLALSGLVLCGQAAGAPPPTYEVVHGWPVLPEGYILGQTTGVDVDSRGDVWVFHRAGRTWTEPMPKTVLKAPVIVVFDGRTGAVKNALGDGLFVMPHGLTIDAQDNVWLTDVALQQVIKLSPDGKVLMIVGVKGVAGADARHFNRPTDVAVAADGSFYVSDGYENSRVVKFSADGKFLFQWGKRGKGPGEFDLPHAIALDDTGRVYVADRENDRVQVFDGEGKFLNQWQNPDMGRPYSVTIAGRDRAFVVDGGEQPKSGPDRGSASELTLNGQMLSRFGRYGNQDGQFRLAHDVAVDTDGAVYVVDTLGERVQKFVRTP